MSERAGIGYVRVGATSDWKDMESTWQIGFQLSDPNDRMAMMGYTNAVYDTISVLLGKLGREFTVSGVAGAPDIGQIMQRIEAIQAGINNA